MQNEKKYIRYKGITRLPSEHDSFDGELEDVVNMALTGGELRPVLPPELIDTIPGQFMFVHKNQGFEHFISLDGSTVKAYDYKDGSITSLGDITNIYGEEIVKCEAVGNVLVILTDKEVKYALWKDTYQYLGNNIPFPNISFNLSTASTTPERFWAILGNFSSDISKLAQAPGHYPHRRSSIDRGDSIVSSDFKNEIFGRINNKLSSIMDGGKFIFPFFVRYALRLYDGSLVKHSQPFMMLPTKFIPFTVSIDSVDENKIEFQFPYGSVLRYSYSGVAGISRFSDIIQSVDIFISRPIYSYLYDGEINGMIDNPGYKGPGHIFPEKIMSGFFKSRDDIMEEIESTGSFYLVHSIPINDLESSQSNKEIKIKNLDTIVHRELMTDDYLSHDKIVAENSFTYNHKLHLSGISRSMFPGFKLADQRCYYEGAKNEASIEIGNQPFIFYPGKSSHLTIAEYTQDQWGETRWREKSFKLNSHPTLNGSYYIDPDLNNITNDGPFGSTSIDVKILFAQQKQDESEVNKLYVSAHQNPFIFPVNSRITLPVGKIIGVASNTEAISQGQFGQFPLYAFTDDGIWALEVGSDGRYTARQPVSRDVAINPNVLQMDSMIAFITAKGVTLLSGSDSQPISEIIRENNIRSSRITISSMLDALNTSGVLDSTIKNRLQTTYNTDVPFETFSAGASLAYDYITGSGRILLINPLYDYSYVFDLGTSTWSKVTTSYKRVVNNYPDCYVQDGEGVVYNLSHIPDALDNTTTCMIITRPIKYNDLNFVIRSLSHRGIFKSVLNVGIYASRNGQDYHLIKTGKEKLIRMTGSGYMYYKILVIANLKPNEVISGIDLDFMVKYSNRMR